MRTNLKFLLVGLSAALSLQAVAQGGMTLPKSVQAGSAFSIQCSGTGKATLYIVGPGQALKRDLQLGETAYFPGGSLHNAGRYVALLAGDSVNSSDSFDVVGVDKPAELSFLAKPSRLPVGLHGGITGAVYVFDPYRNLITTPMPVSFELSDPVGSVQKREVTTREGAAWISMDSTSHDGVDRFVAESGGISSTRVVRQVPGDPCGLKMNARQAGRAVQLTTDPVRDCSGNAVPDGTIVTFTETGNGVQTTVDAPLKHGIAEVQMPASMGATISVASGVVLGNQIRWEK